MVSWFVSEAVLDKNQSTNNANKSQSHVNHGNVSF